MDAFALDRVESRWLAGPVCVALSGGMDSTALLHACAATPSIRARGLAAIHVDHGLNPDSARWAAWCVAFAGSLGLACRVVRVDVGSTRRSGLEAAARRARYTAIEAALAPGTVVLAAHHADDQAETVLLRLLRGAGVGGLAAMRAQRPLGACTLVRPWLAVPRVSIAEYARSHGLEWIDDPSNRRLDHDRNFLRHQVLPLLAARWPSYAARFGASAALAAAAADSLDRATAITLADCQGADPATLRIDPLLELGVFERAEVLRAWIARLGHPAPDAAALASIESALAEAASDRTPRIAWRGAELRRHRDLLHAMAPLPRVDPEWRATWDGMAPLVLPQGLGTLALDTREPLALTVQWRRGGERIVVAPNRPSQSLKHLLQDLGVPPWQRTRLPLVFRDDELWGAGDLVRSHAQVASGVRLAWTPAQDDRPACV